MAEKKGKKKIKLQDLKPKKDVKGGFLCSTSSHTPSSHTPSGHTPHYKQGP